MKFILPRIAALALIAGIASFLLAMIAKVLIGATIIGGIVMLAKKAFNNRRRGHEQAMIYGPQGFNQMQYANAPFFKNNVMPVNKQSQRSNGIIPIN
jgi:hypothetical protein